MRQVIQFFVPGIPAPAGSKTAYRTKSRGIAVTHASKKTAPWSADVKAFAIKAWDKSALTGPIRLTTTFFFRRPQNHYGTGRNAGKLKSWVPRSEHCIRTPDLTKLVRCIEDCLTGIIWVDDKQVVEQYNYRCYADDVKPGARITILALNEAKKDG